MKIAVVGAGISGLASAWLLSSAMRSPCSRPATTSAATPTPSTSSCRTRFPVDTGFLVFNHRTYPNLTALFRELKVDTVASDMSFAVSMVEPDLEWAGSSLATLFAQKRNLARPGFWRMLQDTLRFNRETAVARCLSDAGRLPRTARLQRRIPRLVPAAHGGGDLVLPDAGHARLPADHLRPLRPQPRPAAGLRPAAVADGQGRRPRVCRAHRRGTGRRAPGDAGEIGAARCRRRLAGPARRRMRTLRRGGAGLPQRPGAGPARQRGHPGRAAHPRRHPLPAQPRRAAYRCRPAAARRARLVGVELHGRENAAAASSRSASPT
jgi:hypothetical protein